MKIVVIGAGLIGLTAAYFLSKRGHEVTVLDRQPGPGLETSFANGCLLTPSMPEPWNAPGCGRVLLGSLGRSDAPLQLRLSALPSLSRWGVTFLRNSGRKAFERNTVSNVRLALHSLKVQKTIRQDARLEYSESALGTLKLFRSSTALKESLGAAERLLQPEGLRFCRLSRDETASLEPALRPISRELAGALHYLDDQTGDAYRFCVGLTEFLRAIGVKFLFGRNVPALGVTSNRKAVRCEIEADQYVMAAGCYSTPLFHSLGVRLPVRPAKGYSVTFALPRGTSVLKIPVVDDDMHAALVPVGNALRVAGTAEFAGFDLTLRPERVRNVASLAERILPGAGLDPGTARPWCGLRPMSADGVPIIGRTPIENLWVSTGHGHLGWTMAAGSGQLLAELLSGDAPSVDPAPYALNRF